MSLHAQCVCGVNVDFMHALVLCDYSRNVWRESGLLVANLVVQISQHGFIFHHVAAGRPVLTQF